MRRTFKWICVCAWACLLILTLYYSATLPQHFTVERIDVVPDIKHHQNITYTWIAFGLVVALIGLKFDRWWIPTTIVSSLTYLVGWYIRGPMSLVGPIDGYKLMWQTASSFGTYVPFIVRDVLVPAAFLVALAGALLSVRKRQSIPPTAGH